MNRKFAARVNWFVAVSTLAMIASIAWVLAASEKQGLPGALVTNRTPLVLVAGKVEPLPATDILQSPGGYTGLPVNTCPAGRAVVSTATDGTALCATFGSSSFTNAAGTNVVIKADAGGNGVASSIVDDSPATTAHLYVNQGGLIANFFWGNETTFPITSGVGNFGLGLHALHSLTTGINNLAIGWDSQFVSVAGNDNVSVGEDSLKNVATGGDNNTAVGYAAGIAITTGVGNTVVGENALSVLTTGSNNVAVGLSSGIGLGTTSTGNVAVGYAALHAANSNDNNTAIGYTAGYNNTGASNIFLGQSAGVNETGSNKLYIDSLGGGSTNAIIYGVMNAAAASQTLFLNALVNGLNTSGWALSASAASSTVPTVIPNRADLTTGMGASASGVIDIINAGRDFQRFDNFANVINMASSAGWELAGGASSATVPSLIPNKASIGAGIGATASGNVNIIAGSVTLERFVNTGPAASAGSVATGSRDRAGSITGVGATSATLTFGTTTYARAWCVANFNGHAVAPEIVEVTESLTAPVFNCFNSTTGVAANCDDFTYHCDLQ